MKKNYLSTELSYISFSIFFQILNEYLPNNKKAFNIISCRQTSALSLKLLSVYIADMQ